MEIETLAGWLVRNGTFITKMKIVLSLILFPAVLKVLTKVILSNTWNLLKSNLFVLTVEILLQKLEKLQRSDQPNLLSLLRKILNNLIFSILKTRCDLLELATQPKINKKWSLPKFRKKVRRNLIYFCFGKSLSVCLKTLPGSFL